VFHIELTSITQIAVCSAKLPDSKNSDKRTVNHIILNGKYTNVLTAHLKTPNQVTYILLKNFKTPTEQPKNVPSFHKPNNNLYAEY
jgi:hypothetical protein